MRPLIKALSLIALTASIATPAKAETVTLDCYVKLLNKTPVMNGDWSFRCLVDIAGARVVTCVAYNGVLLVENSPISSDNRQLSWPWIKDNKWSGVGKQHLVLDRSTLEARVGEGNSEDGDYKCELFRKQL
jgi:hypothetical protein